MVLLYMHAVLLLILLLLLLMILLSLCVAILGFVSEAILLKETFHIILRCDVDNLVCKTTSVAV